MYCAVQASLNWFYLPAGGPPEHIGMFGLVSYIFFSEFLFNPLFHLGGVGGIFCPPYLNPTKIYDIPGPLSSWKDGREFTPIWPKCHYVKIMVTLKFLSFYDFFFFLLISSFRNSLCSYYSFKFAQKLFSRCTEYKVWNGVTLIILTFWMNFLWDN